jgi:multidrug efflux pump subunit AcrA (membrane-fusion protein)
MGTKLGIALGGFVLVVGIAFGAWSLMHGFRPTRTDLIYHTLQKEMLQITIVERGALESAENKDVVCRVKASQKGGTVASSIKSVIENGSIVEAGQILAELDDSGLQDQLQTERINCEKAKAEWIKAREGYAIQESQNISDIASAKVKLEQALGEELMAHSDLEMWEERAAWSERMSRPGRRYVTSAQADSDQARMVSAKITLQTKQSGIDEARRALDRTEKQAVASLAGKEADRTAAYSTYLQEIVKVRDLEEEVRKCTLKAPQDGLVVYFIPEQSRSGAGTQQAIVAQGEPVREGQKLMSIPNLSKMVVNTRVHEAMISKVRGDKYVRTGFSDAVAAGLWFSSSMPVPVFGAQLAFAQTRTEFSDQNQEFEQTLVEKGQPATIRIDSVPGKVFRGHVKSVATVASQQDWMSSDVKVYQTMVSIDDTVENVRPGMSAEVTILTDAKEDHILAIPVEAVLGASELGRRRECFVKTPAGPQRRKITLGMSNDTKAEVLDGLEEGDEIVLNPRVLLTPDERGNQPERKGFIKGAKGKGRGPAEGGETPPAENGNGKMKKKGNGRLPQG